MYLSKDIMTLTSSLFRVPNQWLGEGVRGRGGGARPRGQTGGGERRPGLLSQQAARGQLPPTQARGTELPSAATDAAHFCLTKGHEQQWGEKGSLKCQQGRGQAG